MNDISKVSLFYYGDKVFIVYLMKLMQYWSLLAWTPGHEGTVASSTTMAAATPLKAKGV